MAILSNLGIEFAFNYPQFIYWLLLIPGFILIYLFSMFYKHKKSIGFPNFEALKRTGLTEVYSKNTFYLYLFLFIIFCLVMSLAGTSVSFNSKTSEFSYVIALDNSDSMRATDLQPNRLEVSKSAAKEFISSLPLGSRVSVITFSGDVKVISGLESSQFGHLGDLDSITFSDVSGTNVKGAVLEATTILKKEKLKSIIVLSDGQINVGNITETIDYANENNLVINTIAIGTSVGGDTGYGFISKTDIDMLKALSFNTNGKFFNVTNSMEMDKSFGELSSNSLGVAKVNLSPYLLTFAILLITLYWVLYNFRFRNFP